MLNTLIKNSLLLLAGIFPVSFAVNAQLYAGIQSGYTRNRPDMDLSQLSYTRDASAGGYYFGFSLRDALAKHFYCQSVLSIIQKNYSLVRTGPYNGVYEDFSNTYIHIPLMAGWVISHNRVGFSLHAGTYVDIWLSGRIKGNVPDIFSPVLANNNSQSPESLALAHFDEARTFNPKTDRRLEWGILCSPEINYSFREMNAVSLGITWLRALTDQQKTYMIDQQVRRNRSLLVAIGYTRSIRRKKK